MNSQSTDRPDAKKKPRREQEDNPPELLETDDECDDFLDIYDVSLPENAAYQPKAKPPPGRKIAP
jgi:hypothetical protein